MKRVDLVYFHIHGPDNSQELMFALRSIEKYFENENYKIHIIGEKPTWLNTQRVNFIPVNRISGKNLTVYMDVVNKFKLVTKSRSIGADFYRMMDDIYFINPVQKADLDKLLALEDFSGTNIETRKFQASTKWANLMRKTIMALRHEEKSEYSYAHHLPQKFNKRNLNRLFEIFNIPNELYLIGTLYNNYFLSRKPDHFLLPYGAGIKLGLYKKDYSLEDLHRMRGENIFMNNSIQAYNAALVKFLQQLFPEKSKFEI